jgi:subtilase family serine protease
MRRVRKRLRAAVIAAAATTLAVGVLSTAASAQSSPARMRDRRNPPRVGGRVGSRIPQAVTTGTVTARVYLAGQNQAGLAAYATAVSTPGNALYGHYLTPAQVKAEFGPTAAQVSAVQSWLTGAGLTVTKSRTR